MKLAIIGAGEQAREILSLITNSKTYYDYEEIVLVDLEADAQKNIISESYFFSLPINEFEIIIAMGEPAMRARMMAKYKEKGYRFATYVHESVVVGNDTKLLPGVILLPFVYIAQDVRMGENTLVHAGARIENNCVIGNSCFISSGAFIGAKTIIGNNTFVGPNAAVKDQLVIGDHAIIGMGSNVIKNVEEKCVVAGNPAKKIRDNISMTVFS